jgi:hypothetical protein
MPSRMEEFGFFLTRTFASSKAQKREWPFVPGKYFVVSPSAPVAVTTLGSVDLAKEVAGSPPSGLCIVGKVETENIGIEKMIKNILSNPSIRYLIIEGQDARSIYLTIVRNDWVSKLDHAAYLGKQLAKAELSIEHRFEFLQDGG